MYCVELRFRVAVFALECPPVLTQPVQGHEALEHVLHAERQQRADQERADREPHGVGDRDLDLDVVLGVGGRAGDVEAAAVVADLRRAFEPQPQLGGSVIAGCRLVQRAADVDLRAVDTVVDVPEEGTVRLCGLGSRPRLGGRCDGRRCSRSRAGAGGRGCARVRLVVVLVGAVARSLKGLSGSSRVERQLILGQRRLGPWAVAVGRQLGRVERADGGGWLWRLVGPRDRYRPLRITGTRRRDAEHAGVSPGVDRPGERHRDRRTVTRVERPVRGERLVRGKRFVRGDRCPRPPSALARR